MTRETHEAGMAMTEPEKADAGLERCVVAGVPATVLEHRDPSA